MDKHIYTLVCYRENGIDTCRGCVMERSDSAFDLIVADTAEKIAYEWARKMFENAHRGKYSVTCSWEVTLLIDGYSPNSSSNYCEYDEERDIFCSDTYYDISKRQGEIYCDLMAEKREQDALASDKLRKQEEDKAEKARLAKEECDLKEFKRLQVKFANCGNCWKCLEGKTNEAGWSITGTRMILCSTCGNKRCPRASDHNLNCTNSNESGQPGSVY